MRSCKFNLLKLCLLLKRNFRKRIFFGLFNFLIWLRIQILFRRLYDFTMRYFNGLLDGLLNILRKRNFFRPWRLNIRRIMITKSYRRLFLDKSSLLKLGLIFLMLRWRIDRIELIRNNRSFGRRLLNLIDVLNKIISL